MSARKKIKSLFSNKQFLMAFSLLISIILWVFVATVISPNHTTTIYNVPVVIDSSGTSLEKLNLELFETEPQTINITVTGKRYLVSQLNKNDFSVSVPISRVVGPGEYKLEVTPNYVGNKDMDFSIVDYSKKTMNFFFDYRSSKAFNVEADISELKFADGYTADIPNVITDPIMLEGPKTEIDNISKVVAVIQPKNTKRIKETTTLKALLIMYDKNGNEYTPRYTVFPEKQIEITVPVVQSAKLPLVVDFENQPNYFKNDSVDYKITPEQVNVTGNTTHLESLENIVVGTVDYSELSTKNNTFTFDVEVPSGITLVDDVTKATVTFDMSDYKEATVDISRFELSNVPAGMDVEVVTEKIKDVKLVLPETFDTSNAGKFYADVDIEDKDYNQGTYNVNVTVKCESINKMWAVGNYTVAIKVN
jgi:hypothetical protein